MFQTTYQRFTEGSNNPFEDDKNNRYAKKKRKTICFDDINDLEEVEFTNSSRPKLSQILMNMTSNVDTFKDVK